MSLFLKQATSHTIVDEGTVIFRPCIKLYDYTLCFAAIVSGIPLEMQYVSDAEVWQQMLQGKPNSSSGSSLYLARLGAMRSISAAADASLDSNKTHQVLMH